MRKLFSAVALLLLLSAGTASAQEKKSWDFTKGLSEKTIENLTADAANWASNGTDADGNTNNWQNSVKQSADSYWLANGEVIEELRGLKIDIGSNKANSIHLATTKVRLTRANTTVTFPKLANGQTVTIVGRSANATATNRGIAPNNSNLQFLADESSPQTGGACIFVGGGVEGSEGTYTFKWKVVTDSPDSVDVQFKLTPDAGIDFTLFQIDQGDAPGVEEAKKVAYLYSGDASQEITYMFIESDSRFTTTAIDVATAPSADELRQYDAVLISSSIPADNAYVAELSKVIAFVPVLNLNAGIYEPLGLGKAILTATNKLTITATDNEIFEGLDAETEYQDNITAVELGDYFANDQVLATAGDAVAIHAHNAKRNAYYYVPELNAGELVYTNLIPQTLLAVAGTKADVKAVGTPVITPTQENGYTVVTITATNSKKIYYTLDGSEPTEASTLYTEPFTLTQSATVKAKATGDGYTDSNIGEKEIAIMVKAATPAASVSREQGKSTITLSTATADADIYFNFNGSEAQTQSQKYEAPIELTEPAYVTFFAISGTTLQSETATQFVGIDGIDKSNIRWDIISHMSAPKEDWYEVGEGEGRTNSANYIFWKSARTMYTDEVDHTETVKASDGVTDSTVYVYKTVPVTEIKSNAGDWMVTSLGQVMTWESITAGKNVGVAGSNCPETAFDLLPVNGVDNITNNILNFKGKLSGEPYNATIQTVDKVAGPFDIVVYFNNGSAGNWPKVNVEISADGSQWTLVDTLTTRDVRLMKRTRLSYEGTDAVYVRLAHVGGNSAGQVFDIYLMNNGELSKEYAEETVGIADLDTAVRVIRTEAFTLGGARTSATGRGLRIVRKTYSDGTVKTSKVLNK